MRTDPDELTNERRRVMRKGDVDREIPELETAIPTGTFCAYRPDPASS